jgi:hypothetical protein
VTGIHHSFQVKRVPLFVEPGRQNASYGLGMDVLDDVEEKIHHRAHRDHREKRFRLHGQGSRFLVC